VDDVEEELEKEIEEPGRKVEEPGRKVEETKADVVKVADDVREDEIVAADEDSDGETDELLVNNSLLVEELDSRVGMEIVVSEEEILI
jgi:hypothetical protein